MLRDSVGHIDINRLSECMKSVVQTYGHALTCNGCVEYGPEDRKQAFMLRLEGVAIS